MVTRWGDCNGNGKIGYLPETGLGRNVDCCGTLTAHPGLIHVWFLRDATKDEFADASEIADDCWVVDITVYQGDEVADGTERIPLFVVRENGVLKLKTFESSDGSKVSMEAEYYDTITASFSGWSFADTWHRFEIKSFSHADHFGGEASTHRVDPDTENRVHVGGPEHIVIGTRQLIGAIQPGFARAESALATATFLQNPLSLVANPKPPSPFAYGYGFTADGWGLGGQWEGGVTVIGDYNWFSGVSMYVGGDQSLYADQLTGLRSRTTWDGLDFVYPSAWTLELSI